jgi:hypothetical protein
MHAFLCLQKFEGPSATPSAGGAANVMPDGPEAPQWWPGQGD